MLHTSVGEAATAVRTTSAMQASLLQDIVSPLGRVGVVV
jgi:hypothetical protein